MVLEVKPWIWMRWTVGPLIYSTNHQSLKGLVWKGSLKRYLYLNGPEGFTGFLKRSGRV